MSLADPIPRAFPSGNADTLDIDPELALLRREAPVCRVRLPYGGNGWLVTRHADVKTVLADRRFSRAAAMGPDVPRSQPSPPVMRSILSMDPPEHTRLRTLVSKAFTARRVGMLRARAREIADELATAMRQHGPPVDLAAWFALPLPITVICELLGVPYVDRHRFREWSDALLATTAFTAAEVEQARLALAEYLAGLVADRRAEPTDDLLGVLVRARDEEGRLSEQELVIFALTLLVAGHETTASQITNFVCTLLRTPGEYPRLRSDPGLLPGAIEELLRFVPLGSGGGFARIATEDIELSGVTIAAGDAVFVSGAAANRDDTVFESGDRLCLDRAVNPHLAFGHGVHHCLGAQLARMELQVALGTLLARFPDLALDEDGAGIVWKRGLLVRGPRTLPVRW